jgi:arabinan endo-1,5-alpha-L-arabinosidase
MVLQAQIPSAPISAQNGSTPTDWAQMAELTSRGVHVHDPSTIVKSGREYWLFYTGRGVPSFHSSDLKTWIPGPTVFTSSPAWTDPLVPGHRRNNFWAPEIVPLNDNFLLYYAVSTFGKNVSAIGLATNATLDPADPKYRWVDCGPVIHSSATNDFNAIDPSIARDANGRLWLSFGSFWSGVKLIQLDPATGKQLASDSPIYSLAHNDSIEASYLYPHAGYYYLFVNWGLCCQGTNSTYEVRMGRSRQITGPYLDADGVDMMEDGGSPFLQTSGSFIGPGQVGICTDGGTNWLSCHFYDGKRRGFSTLAVLPLQWQTNGWPAIAPAAIKKYSE